jgi:8-oxo-dGTP diphosphatase
VKLAFDHDEIISRARRNLMDRLNDPTCSTSLDLVPPRFTLTELQRVYEAVWGRSVDKRNFRSRLLARGLVEPVAKALRTGRHRPAQLYRWKQ